MSRDFTPRDLFFVDRELKKTQGQGLRDAVITLKPLHPDENGKEIILGNTQTKVICPEMGFLYDRADDFFDEFRFRGVEILKQAEQIICEIEEAFLEDKTYTPKDDFTKIMYQWFCGELDPDFYYHETNDELLYEFMSDKVKALTEEWEEETEEDIER